MIQDTIQKIEAKLNDKAGQNKAELLALLSQLKTEINHLAETNTERAESVAGFAELSTHEATKSAKDPALLDLSIKGLSRSVEDFEGSHPELVAVVNRICTTLSNMGI